MAVYKVPQDVEADDKLIGPFSFRQFIYLIIVAIGIAGAWGLSRLFIPLAIIPLPIIVFFAALALPLRKDQPMEAYLSAVVSFYFLKSRKRLWQPDGIDSFVTIIPPKDADKILTKNLDEDEATKRLGYLADLVDTHGWAIRGAGATPDTSINTDLYYESQQTVDMMDDTTPAAQAMEQKLKQEAADHKQEAVDSMKAAAKETPPAADAQTVPAPTASIPDTTAAPKPVPQAAPAKTTPPVSKLPPTEQVRAKENTIKQKDSLDAIALANALAEEAGDKHTAQSSVPASATAVAPVVTSVPATAKTPEKPTTNTSVSTPDTGTIGLTQEQANELSEQKDVSLQTLSGQANRIAKQNQENKVLKDGDEVTISFH